MSKYSLKCLPNDPVINLYNDLIKHSQIDLTLPMFSEIFLRFALNECYPSNDQSLPQILHVYRKLLVLYYKQLYPSMDDVQKIMESIFNYFDLINIIDESSQVLQEWQAFAQSNFE